MKIFKQVSGFYQNPSDSPEEALKKTLLVLSTFTMAVIVIPWALIYYFLGNPQAAWSPVLYSILSFSSLVYYSVSKKYSFFKILQLTMTLVLPFLVSISLGGFHPSSIVIIWSFTSPMGAFLFGTRKQALWFFIATIFLIVVSAFLEPYQPLFAGTQDLPEDLVSVFYVMNLGTVLFLVFFFFSYFIKQREELFRVIAIEQQKAETLLLNILPKHIADTLKNNNQTIAENYQSVSILFVDMVGFTSLSGRLKPEEVVRLLNDLFSYFDMLAEKYQLEKIKTIGDCYMVAAGIPSRYEDHAERIVKMAVEARDYFRNHEISGFPIHLRFGINTGPVVAGVIGRKKFIYDVWGDAVNIASRMESRGESGEIQITKDVYDLVKEKYICESRGAIEIKGKGKMEVWLVKQEKGTG